MTTREKIHALVDELRRTPPEAIGPESRDLVELLQIAEGLGVDLLGSLIPASDADADLQVDALITLLLQIRGDDLPPYDYARAVGETA